LTKVFGTARLLYYSSNWAPVVEEATLCRYDLGGFVGDRRCGGTQDCNTIFSEPSMGGVLSGLAVFLPGVSTCQDSFGCAANGCVSCEPGCAFGRFSLNPNPSAFPVWEIADFRTVHEIQICWKDSMGETCEVQTSQQSAQSPGNFTVNSLGELFTGKSYTTNGHKIIYCGPDCAKLVPASEQNIPIRGTIGDIQSGTPLDGSVPLTPGSAIFDQTICTSVLSGNHLKYTCAGSGAALVDRYPPLPERRGSVTWFSDANGIMGIDDDPGPLQIELKTNLPVNLNYITNDVCPEAVFVTMSGCYGCNEGARMQIRAHSSCLEGTVTLMSSKLTFRQPSIELKRDELVFVISFDTLDKDVEDVIVLRGTNDFKLTVTGLLGEPTVNLPHTNETVSPGTSSVHDTLNNWDWGQRIALIVGVSVGAVLLLVLLGVGVYYLEQNMWFHKWFGGKEEKKEFEELKKDEAMDLDSFSDGYSSEP